MSNDYLLIDYVDSHSHKVVEEDNQTRRQSANENKRVVKIEQTNKKLVKNFKKFKRNSSFSMTENDALRVTFPIIVEGADLENVEFIIFDEKDEQYELPALIKQQYNHIIGAHNTSQIYNQLNVRVDSWALSKGKLFMNTSRVTYFDALVTNRAMDFKWENGTTTREHFNYGPFIEHIGDSQLANILGLFGFVMSKDG